MAHRLQMFGPTRGFSGMADSMEPCKCCGADPCCHGNEIWARRGDPVAYRFVRDLSYLSVISKRNCLVRPLLIRRERLCLLIIHHHIMFLVIFAMITGKKHSVRTSPRPDRHLELFYAVIPVRTITDRN